MDKYQETLASSQVNADDAVVAAEVKKIVEKAGQYATSDVYQFLFSSIDLTTLSTTDTQTSVAQFVKRVNDFDNDYPQFKNVAAICVYSDFAEIVRSNLEVSGVDIAVVAGGFPSSQTFTEVKVADAALAVAGGANEVDIVMNLGYYLDNNYAELSDEIIEIKHAIRDAKLKVILETGALKSALSVRRYCRFTAKQILSRHRQEKFIRAHRWKLRG